MGFEDFIAAVLGGFLIGVSVVLLLWSHGRIAGISGIFHNVLTGQWVPWRMAFLIGLVIGMALLRWLETTAPFESLAWSPRLGFPWEILLLAGVLVGMGTRLANGCTSGHGVCGLGRFSKRSLAATSTFMLVAAITVFVTRHLI
ncbi:MAG: YeeE/YedE family protein [Candidatus Competibacterales bacterium]